MGFKRTAEGRVFFQNKGQGQNSNNNQDLSVSEEQDVIAPSLSAQVAKPSSYKKEPSFSSHDLVKKEETPLVGGKEMQVLGLLRALNDKLKNVQLERSKLLKDLGEYKEQIHSLEDRLERSELSYMDLEQKLALKQNEQSKKINRVEKNIMDTLDDVLSTKDDFQDLKKQNFSTEEQFKALKEQLSKLETAKNNKLLKRIEALEDIQNAFSKKQDEQGEKIVDHLAAYAALAKKVAESDTQFKEFDQTLLKKKEKIAQIERKVDKVTQDRTRLLNKIDRIEDAVMQMRDTMNIQAIKTISNLNDEKEKPAQSSKAQNLNIARSKKVDAEEHVFQDFDEDKIQEQKKREQLRRLAQEQKAKQAQEAEKELFATRPLVLGDKLDQQGDKRSYFIGFKIKESHIQTAIFIIIMAVLLMAIFAMPFTQSFISNVFSLGSQSRQDVTTISNNEWAGVTFEDDYTYETNNYAQRSKSKGVKNAEKPIERSAQTRQKAVDASTQNPSNSGVASSIEETLLLGTQNRTSQTRQASQEIDLPPVNDNVSIAGQSQNQTLQNQTPPSSTAIVPSEVIKSKPNSEQVQLVKTKNNNTERTQQAAIPSQKAIDDIGTIPLEEEAQLVALLAENPNAVAKKLNAIEPGEREQSSGTTLASIDNNQSRLTRSIKPVPPPKVYLKPDENLPESIKSIEKQAIEGVAEAQHDLAAIYTAGHAGVTQDFERAAFWFERASQGGIANAAYNLGVLNHQGLGVAKNSTKAIDLYQKAANANHPEAQYNLAIAYIEGAGVDYNPQKAAKLFEQSANQGIVEAAYNLGLIHENGLLGKIKPDEALLWYKKASDKGNPEAKAALKQLANSLNITLEEVNKIAEDMNTSKVFKKAAPRQVTAKPQTIFANKNISATNQNVAKVQSNQRLERSQASNQTNTVKPSTNSARVVKEKEVVNWKQNNSPSQANTSSPSSQKNASANLRNNDALKLASIAPNSGPNAPASPELTAEIQKHLMRLSLYPGPADGIMGPLTEDAIRSYQSDHNLPTDGIVSEDLLDHMASMALFGQEIFP